MKKLEIPCSYQGGKQRLAKQIIDIICSENIINDNTKFYDLCCGSGAVTLELLNRGFNPNNVVMIDSGCMGAFWMSIANDEFDLDEFRVEIDKLPAADQIQSYLKDLSKRPVNKNLMIYHYLLLQAGAFGSKQVGINDDKWITPGFRNYWMPTETSNRRSSVNPMMPMPETLYSRVKEIVTQLNGLIVASQEDVFQSLCRLENTDNTIVYIDPPYLHTTGYGQKFNIYKLVEKTKYQHPLYISEGFKMDGATRSYLLSSGRKKGNISGDVKKPPVEEWLNVF